MISIKQQIQQEKQIRKDQIKDLFYVDDCNNCKDPEIRGENYIICSHPWYCHHDNGKVQELEASLIKINHNVWLRGFMCAYERVELKRLQNIKFELVKECRRNLPRIKH